MKTKWLAACVAVLIAVTVAVPVGAASSGPKEQDKAKATPPASCSESVKVQSASSDKPRPEVGTVCLKEICKMDGGVLYYCIAHVCQDCCRYDTQADCTPDPNCTVNIPPYCDSPTSCPPNACKNTCGPHSCGNTVCH